MSHEYPSKMRISSSDFRKYYGVILLLTLVSACSNAASKPSIAGKFTPPGDKTLMIVGQDSDAIDNYIHAIPEDNIEGFTLYSNLKHADPKQTLHGMKQSANWQAGLVEFEQTLNKLPDAAIAIGLAFDKCNSDISHGKNIANGKYDKSIQAMVEYLKSLSPRKVFLRVGYEFDGLWNCYDPDSYKAAFRRIHQKLSEAGVTNVATVWQSATWPSPQFAGERAHLYDFRKDDHLSNWYPGDDVVDWVGISTFYRDLAQYDLEHVYTPDFAQQKALDFARKHNKPLMIAEAAPQGYRIGKQTHSFIGVNKQNPMPAEKMWQNWFVPFFDFIYDNKDVIRAVAYINAHWESQAMWYCAPGAKAGVDENCKNGNWGDTRVQAHPYIKKMWLKEVNNSEHWIQTSKY